MDTFKRRLEDGESIEDGFKRIAKEEIDVVIEILEKIGSNSYIAHPPDGAVRKEVVYLLGRSKDMVLQLKEEKGGLMRQSGLPTMRRRNYRFTRTSNKSY